MLEMDNSELLILLDSEPQLKAKAGVVTDSGWLQAARICTVCRWMKPCACSSKPSYLTKNECEHEKQHCLWLEFLRVDDAFTP